MYSPPKLQFLQTPALGIRNFAVDLRAEPTSDVSCCLVNIRLGLEYEFSEVPGVRACAFPFVNDSDFDIF